MPTMMPGILGLQTVAGKNCDARILSVSSQFVTIPCSMGHFKLTALLDFEAEGAALPTLPPTILIIEGICNGRAEGHPEPRVIASDHSHAFPVFEDFFRLNTAHTHPVTPSSPDSSPGRRPIPVRCWAPRRPRSSPSWTLACEHLPISPSRQCFR